MAEERTELANQRTLLAFVRTFLTMVIVGITMLKFFEVKLVHNIAWVMIIGGIVVFIIGLFDYFRTKNYLKILQ